MARLCRATAGIPLVLCSTAPLYAAAPTAENAPPATNPDHIVMLDSTRVVAVYSATIADQGANRRAWFRVDYPVPPDAGTGARRHWRQVLGLFDCRRRRWQVQTSLRSDPQAADEVPPPASWRAAAADPMASAVFQYVCAYRGPSLSPGETIYLM